MPSLLVLGFDWNEGPLAAIRRDHRQEHYFLRVMTHLACQLDEWSDEDRRHFSGTAREFTSFLRNHMRTEQRDVFEPASRRLSSESKAALSQALAQFDVEAGVDLGTARGRVDGLLAKYAVALPLSA
jgi:hemerythrin-like domain-containing protein